MFDRDYTIRGTHATYMKFLVDKAEVFNRYIDVYMLAPIFGLLYNRPSKENTQENKDAAGMLTEVFIKERTKLVYIFRLVMLLDETTGLNAEQRINRAFREDANKEASNMNLQLFNSYALGGIEVLYEQFSEGCVTKDDYIDKIFDVTNNFKKELNIENIDKELEELISGK